MASYSEMKTGLDDISGIIRDNRAVLVKAKSNGSLASAELASIPTDFAAVIAAIDAIPANTTNAAEMLLKAKADAIAAVDLSV